MDPERPIEKLLRAWANKRRQQAGDATSFELNETGRRRLQRAIAEKFAPKGSRWIEWLRLQLHGPLAWGFAAVALVGIAAALLVRLPSHPNKDLMLAKNEPLSRSYQGEAPPAAAPAPVEKATADKPVETPALDADRMAEVARGQALRDLRAEPTTAAAEASRRLEFSQANSPSTFQMTTKDMKQSEPTPTPATLGGGLAGVPAAPATAAPQAQDALVAGNASRPATSRATTPRLAVTSFQGNTLTERETATADDTMKLGDVSALQAAAARQRLDAMGATGVRAPSGVTTDGASAVLSWDKTPERKGLLLAQRFVRTVPTNEELSKKVFPNGPILVSFQLEQSAQGVRIIDGDGSVYTGSLQPTTAFYRVSSGAEQRPISGIMSKAKVETVAPAAGPVGGLTAPAWFSFRVAGTNRSLKQSVVFTGNLYSAANATSANNFSTLPAAATLKPPAGQLGLPLINSRISGTVSIGNGQPIEINALPANP